MNSTLKCRCGCKQRARRETMLVFGNGAAFINRAHMTASMTTKKAKPTKPAKKKQKTIAKLVDDAAVLLQKLVRMKAAGESGYAQCCTCRKAFHWKDLQGGHFIERGRAATKLTEENCHPQCAGCNCYRMKTASGVLDYRRYMVEMYGERAVWELEMVSKHPRKYTRHEVEGMIFDFKRQIQQQEERLSGSIKQEVAA